jgi:hypothetical protein
MPFSVRRLPPSVRGGRAAAQEESPFADEAQVVGRFELGNPVVEETDAVRLTKAIQFVEPDRPLA